MVIKIQGFMKVTLGGYKDTGFYEGYPGMVIKKFGEIRVKSCPCGYFSPKNSWLCSQLYA